MSPEIENPYRFSRNLWEKFDEHPDLNPNREEAFEEVVDGIGELVEIFLEGEYDEEDPLPVTGHPQRETSVTYDVADTDFYFYVKSRDYRMKDIPDKLLVGSLETSLSGIDPSIDTEGVAPEGTILYKMRDAAQQIADENATDYLSVNDLNSGGGAEGPVELVYWMEIPLDHDEETVEDTVDAVVNTAKELDQSYRKAIDEFSVPT